MKYYVIEIADGDAKVKGKGIYEYADRMKALASFHKKLGTAMDSELYTEYQILCINSANGVEASDMFDRNIIVEPEKKEEVKN